MTKFNKIEVNEGEWCGWHSPVMDGFKLACCDCGLAHDMEFQVLKIVTSNDDGTWTAEEMDLDVYRIRLRARRNNRRTGQIRRHLKT